ncbi:MAG: RluA family pseudouridine synthase [Magnetococcales bacterium]|nr:RluA family pseudouridine synthase [Magnetococcales bacterium]
MPADDETIHPPRRTWIPLNDADHKDLSITGPSQSGFIPEYLAGKRVDVALSSLLSDTSRARIQKAIKTGSLILDGEVITNTRLKVTAEQTYQLTLPKPANITAQAEDIPLKVVYEDDQIIVIDKVAGLVVHPGAGMPDGTLVNALLHHCDTLSNIGAPLRPGIVHRLDKDTTGLIVAAKTDSAHSHLASQFEVHSARRRYLAIIKGRMTDRNLTIEGPIGRHRVHRTRMAVTGQGKRAITHVQSIQAYNLLSLVACRLETGRTHQIRVHLTHKGYPLLGDSTYGRSFNPPRHWPETLKNAINAMKRQALHAAELTLTHPTTEKRMRFRSPVPDDMAEILALLERFAD